MFTHKKRNSAKIVSTLLKLINTIEKSHKVASENRYNSKITHEIEYTE